ncbi:hypothetical protein ACKWTF_014853 [Chironomus riparius]
MDLENPNDNSSNNCDHSDGGCENGSGNNSDLVFNGIIPQSFMMLPGVMMDPSLLGLQQFPTILNLPQNLGQQHNQENQKNEGNGQVKEVIHCPSCSLIPPNPNAPPPSTRERPPGCRTVFVGGLPENITEAIIHEIFERCGEITTLRLSKKNFCHIRFVFEASVDSAIYLSGYRVKIGNNNDPTNTGRLHVDYAQARDDQYEYECKQRQCQREQRHREKDRNRSTSPPAVPHYTDHEATNVAEKIKNDETFLKAVQTLVLWLERGDCSKKNSNIFYSMIQSANSHIRRLLNEKTQFEDEMNEARNHYRTQMTKMIDQFNQIEKVFNAASHKKVWDHFTKPQRKNIDQWCKQASDVRTFQMDENLDNNDEMDMSDDDSSSRSGKRIKLDKARKKDDRSSRSLSHDIKYETDSLSSHKIDVEIKSKQIKVLQETIRNLQRKLMETSTKEKQNEAKIAELEILNRESNVKELLLRTKIANARSTSQSVDDCSETSSIIEKAQSNIEICSHSEAQLVSLATVFLVIHPNGVKIDAILGYISELITGISESEILDVLVKNEKIFRYFEDDGKWQYCGFKSLP